MRRLNVSRTKVLLGILDAVVLNAAILLAFWLRFDGDIPYEYLDRYVHSFWWVTPLVIVIYYLFGLYNRVWEYVSVEAGVSVLLAVSTSTGAIAAAMMITQHHMWPRSVIVLTGLLCVMFVGGSRFAWRVLRRKIFGKGVVVRRPRKRVLIYGAGDAGASLAGRMLSESGLGYELQGFVDDNPKKVGAWLRGRKVLGTSARLPSLVQRLRTDEVIIAVPSASGAVLGRMMLACGEAHVPCRALPSLLALVDGRVELEKVRSIEVDDLLAREPAEFDIERGGEYLRDSSVLVTGAGGSIGSELCRQICRFGPEHVVLLGRGENRIHRIYTELAGAFPTVRLTPMICSFTHADRLEKIFERFSPDVVFHAGAHKHVYLMEAHPEEAVWSNVIGTFLLARAAVKHGTRKFVLISTDKAVHPVGVMGATKRMAEIVCQEAGNGADTQFATVRFGNVIGSDGSVIQIWRQQLAAGRPLTITHPETTRYFMTVPEAALLVICAGAVSAGGDTFLLDMGEPIKVAHLAKEMLRLSGHEGDLDRWVTFTGLRPGEKLHETLKCEGGSMCYYLKNGGQAPTGGPDSCTCDGELLSFTEDKRIFKVVCPLSSANCGALPADIERLREAALNGSAEEVRTTLHEILPEYVPARQMGGTDQDG